MSSDCSNGVYSAKDEFHINLDKIAADKSMELQKRHEARIEKIVKMLTGDKEVYKEDFQKIILEDINDANKIILDAVRDAGEFSKKFITNKIKEIL
jgi:hypothetical protein